MKIDKRSTWIFIALVFFFVLTFTVLNFAAKSLDRPIKSQGPDIEIVTGETEFDDEDFKPVGIVPDTKWVEFSNGTGGKLYVYITPFGGVCKIYLGVDSAPHVFAKECYEYIKGLPEEALAEAIRAIYTADIIAIK